MKKQTKKLELAAYACRRFYWGGGSQKLFTSLKEREGAVFTITKTNKKTK